VPATSIAAAARRVLADPLNPRSLAGRARERRWQVLQQRFPTVSSMRVLDLGGWLSSWRSVSGRPAEVVSLNLNPQEDEPGSWGRSVVGDACSPPEWLLEESFDLVYSNSLIEHVGGHQRCLALAEVVHAAAPHHWVQTPYRYFPVEPHWLCPGLQFLPVAARARVASSWPFGFMSSTETTAVDDVLSVSLLSITEMKHYFPRSEVIRDTWLGATKSIVAVL
jgi:hypothetical protein